jgi:hypothetical protein
VVRGDAKDVFAVLDLAGQGGRALVAAVLPKVQADPDSRRVLSAYAALLAGRQFRQRLLPIPAWSTAERPSNPTCRMDWAGHAAAGGGQTHQAEKRTRVGQFRTGRFGREAAAASFAKQVEAVLFKVGAKASWRRRVPLMMCPDWSNWTLRRLAGSASEPRAECGDAGGGRGIYRESLTPYNA